MYSVCEEHFKCRETYRSKNILVNKAIRNRLRKQFEEKIQDMKVK